MSHQEVPPVGVSLSSDVEYRDGRPHPYRARVRWVDPDSKRRTSRSESADTPEAAQAWIDAMMRAARGGVDPIAATMKLSDYGEAVIRSPCAAWRQRRSILTWPGGASAWFRPSGISRCA
jgi:hypothetical protein